MGQVDAAADGAGADVDDRTHQTSWYGAVGAMRFSARSDLVTVEAPPVAGHRPLVTTYTPTAGRTETPTDDVARKSRCSCVRGFRAPDALKN